MDMAKEEKKTLMDFTTEEKLTAKGVAAKDVEYDLTASLLKAAAFRTSEEAVTDMEIRRNGVYYFTVHIHPISDADTRKARKQATVYGKNGRGKIDRTVEKDFNTAKYHSLLIYFATTEEDKRNIWGNKEVMAKYDILEPWETIDWLLAVGEKDQILDEVLKISGFDDGDDEEENASSPEEYAKN